MAFRFSRLAATIAVAPILFAGLSANAQNNGNFVGDNVTFVDVTESNLLTGPLYDSFNVIQDTLLFDPNGFGVQVVPGAGSGFIDSELEMMLVAHPGRAITTIDFSEEGDYSIVGNGSVSVALPYFWEILEVDGVSINPISGSGQTSFSTSASATGGIWDLAFSIDIDGALDLAEQSLGAIGNSVTKMNLRFDNSLSATAENASSVAFVKKKQIHGLDVGTEAVPEPSAAISLAIGLFGLALRRRR